MITDKAGGHIQEKNECKYLVFDSTDESREVLKKYKKFWDGIRNEIKTINEGKEIGYELTTCRSNLIQTMIFH